MQKLRPWPPWPSKKRKPIIAAVNATAASAALWLISGASEIVVTPSGEVGSIGVWSAHVDLSKALEAAGEKVTLIAAGKYKVEQSPYAPLSAGAKADMQKEVDRLHLMFLSDMATGRRTTASRVRSEFGQGRMLSPQEAVKVGLADRVATLETVLAELSRASSPGHAAWALRNNRIARLEAASPGGQERTEREKRLVTEERELRLQRLEAEVASHKRN